MAKVRAASQSVADEDDSYAHRRSSSTSLLDDLDAGAMFLSDSISLFLGETLDIDTMNSEFRRQLRHLSKWTLSIVSQRSERCVLLPDAMPGFSLIAFKKSQSAPAAPRRKTAEPPVDSELVAASMLMSRFCEETGRKAVCSEGSDVLIALFQEEDLRSALAEAGLLRKWK